MEYKGYTIEISVFPDMLSRTYHGVYTIRRQGDVVHTVPMPGGLFSIVDAEIRAERAARQWVDDRLRGS